MKNLMKVLACILISGYLNAQVKVKNISAQKFCSVGSTLFFISPDTGGDFELWKTDGTSAGTVKVKDINPIKGSITNTVYSDIIAFNGEVYFSADDGVNGFELWKSDGTSAGTMMVQDIKPNTDPNFKSSYPQKFCVMNNTLLFLAEDDVNGIEYWKTDGTTSGTVLLKDILPGTYGQYLNSDCRPVVANGLFYFEARTATNSEAQLWQSDGTEPGTVMVKQLTGYSLDKIVVMNNNLYFAAGSTSGPSPTGRELYVSDGTSTGTQLLKDINPGVSESYITKLTSYNGKLFFIAYTPTTGTEVWISDGTAAGTTLIKDIRSGTSSSVFSPVTDLVPVNGFVYFFAADGISGIELWKTDGTNANTSLVKDLIPGAGNQTTSPFMGTAGNILYFSAANATSQKEVFRSDGTSTGTYMLNEIHLTGDADPKFYHDHQGVLYFIAKDNFAHELWKYAGPIGMDELKKDSRLQVYPNPTADKATIKVTKEIVGAKYFVADLLGNLILQGIVSSETISLDLSALASGTYIVKISGADVNISTPLIKE